MRQLDLFRDQLPYRPFATDDFTFGLYRYPRLEALTKRFIQPNPTVLHWWLVFDVDRPGAAHDWQLRDLPAPNITVENPGNGHAHLFYGLEVAVYKGDPFGHARAIYFLAAVEHALAKALEADLGYNGLTSKNPVHAAWRTLVWREDSYDLHELADWLDLEPIDRRRRAPEYGVGRNVNLFNTVRIWSYRAVRRYWEGSFDAWFEAVLEHCATENTANDPPLAYAEFKHIAKSIARWTWDRFNPMAFSLIQSARGKRSGEIRRQQAEERRRRVAELAKHHPTASLRELARLAGVSKSTVGNALSGSVQRTISESPQGELAL